MSTHTPYVQLRETIVDSFQTHILLAGIILFGSKEKRVSIGKYLETRALTITDPKRALNICSSSRMLLLEF